MHQYYLFQFSFGREIYRTDIFTFLERVVNYSQVVQTIILAEMNKSVIDKDFFTTCLSISEFLRFIIRISFTVIQF